MTLEKGIKFTSQTFMDDAEISNVRHTENKVDVIMTTSEGHKREVKDWDLLGMIELFEKGVYKLKEVDRNSISVW